MKAKKVFVVAHRSNGSTSQRLIRGTLKEVESLVLSEHSIEIAKPEACVELGAAGVKVEEAAA